MHPRNIFKEGVKFEDLANKHDFFKPFLLQEKPGKYIINFDDKESVAALNRALLLEYFNLDVNIPTNFLIPRVPLRVNYILWIEDLLQEHLHCFNKTAPIRGLDIGTGPTAIYALLGAKMNGWEMCGTDINAESVKLANGNVKRNDLGENIKIFHVTHGTYFKEVCDSSNFDFSMCNPPFFSETKDPLVRVDSSEPSKWENKSEVPEEIICPGGEVEFVLKMIQESKAHTAVRIFTTMFGVKKHLTTVIKKIKELGLKNFKTSIFHQGRTSRWGLAWSWDSSIQLSQSPTTSRKSVVYETRFKNIQSLQNFILQLKSVFECLEMKVEEKSPAMLSVEATKNTWSHSRRKRRQEMLAKQATKHQSTTGSIEAVTESETYSANKMPRLDDLAKEKEEISACTPHPVPIAIVAENAAVHATSANSVGLRFTTCVTRELSDVLIRLELIDGCFGKDGMHQVLQYLKNKQFR